MKKEKKQRVYISGPLTDPKTGKPSVENLTAFKWANSRLKKEGYVKTTNPTKVWVCRWPWMYRLLERLVGKEIAYRIVLLYDIILLLRCDIIYKIPGWQQSRGANIESCVAYHFKIWPMSKDVISKIDKRMEKLIIKFEKQ